MPTSNVVQVLTPADSSVIATQSLEPLLVISVPSQAIRRSP
jgi:hypothetical protein